MAPLFPHRRLVALDSLCTRDLHPCGLGLTQFPRRAALRHVRFFDSFNPSFRDTHVSLRSGSVDGRLGWVDNDYLSDNQGPILGMIANYKTGIIWNATRKVPNLVRGLKRAGFTGGWLNGA